MMADAADEVRLETSADRTGVLLALLISSWKLGGALSVGIGFIALDFIGYQAKLGAANTPAALNGLQLLFILSPTILSLIAAFFTWGYPLTATRHGEIREALEARDRALAPAEEGPLGPLGGQVAAAE
jgi:Na+/melibiose symporter-like transporter